LDRRVKGVEALGLRTRQTNSITHISISVSNLRAENIYTYIGAKVICGQKRKEKKKNVLKADAAMKVEVEEQKKQKREREMGEREGGVSAAV
jgi:hypothetical protein